MSYETYRNQIIARLSDKLPAKLLNDVMQEIDLLSTGYTIEKTCTDLIVSGRIPEIVKIYVASLGVQNCAKSTLTGYTRELDRFFASVRKPFTAVTANDIRCYLFAGQQAGSWQPSTMEHVRVIINGFFSWLVDNEYLSRNPARVIKPVRIPKKKLPPMQQIELEQIRNACETDRERAMVDFLFATGCRVSEATAVMLSDIDWNERSVRIRHGKGDKERITYFNAEAEVSMRRYLASRPGEDDHLFTKGRAPYTGLTKEAVEHEIKHICERIPDKLPNKVTPHSFRRTMGTQAVARGCPIEKVKEMLGHESLDTTMRYVTISQMEVKQAHEKFLAG